MPKPLGDIGCRNRLTKWVLSNYSEQEQDYIEYYNDIVTEREYAFRFITPKNKVKVLLTINRITREIRKEYWS